MKHLELNKSVDVTVYEVTLDGENLKFEADVDSEQDICIQITSGYQSILNIIPKEEMINYLENKGYEVSND